MRGKDCATGKIREIFGITPAYAGKRLCMAAKRDIQQDHPRLCGEKKNLPIPQIIVSGSPPPMRGKARGIMPVNVPRGDHPRLCGEKRTN